MTTRLRTPLPFDVAACAMIPSLQINSRLFIVMPGADFRFLF